VTHDADAIVVGSGPNGLAAAIVLARAGVSVLVIEGAPTIGGGTRTEALTLPGFQHDVCSAVHPLGVASPMMASLPLESYGVEWVQPPVAMAHALDGGRAARFAHDLAETAAALGEDGPAYTRLMGPFTAHWSKLAQDVLAPLRVPSHPWLLARFGLTGIRSCTALASRFARPETRAMLAGIAAHSIQPLSAPGTAAAAILLAVTGHVAGWPVVRGGSERISEAMAAYLTSLGGRIVTGTPIASLDELPPSRAVLLDLTPRQVLQVAGGKLAGRYRDQLLQFRYGPGIFKMDWALSGPVPWSAPDCNLAGTVHLGGTLEEVAAGEAAVASGEHPDRPFVLVAQQSRFDPSRAPAGQQTLWAYCHVPAGSTVDMTSRIEAQIERFAPGFRDLILARHTITSVELQTKNPNMVGGDIGAGANTLRQLFFRPTVRWNPYSTPVPGLYLCSASTPPGGGVHGMCGYHAAVAALGDRFGVNV
jgi:phytoene dehydrogenase-like protein